MAAPLTFGTAFATAGFSADANLSPFNQQFANAVLAVCGRAGLPFGFETANAVLAGPAAGVAALPTYRAIVTADLPATVGTVLGVDAVMGGAGTSCGVWTNQHITTVGTATLTLNAFNGTLAGLVPSSSGGSTNYLRADGTYAQPPGTATGSVTGVNAVMAGAGTSCGTWSNQLITTAGTSTLKLNAFDGTLAGLVPSSTGGSTNYLRADGTYAQPPGTATGSVTGVNAVMAGAGTSCGTWSNQLITTAGTSTLTLNAFNGTLAGLVPSSVGGSTNYLRADGSYAQPPGTTVGANPTAVVGTAAINGVATTYMRSDAAPGINLSMAPVWLGGHQFNANTFFGGDSTGYTVAPTFGFKNAGVINVGIRDTTDSVEMLLRCDSSGGIFGMVTASQLAVRTNNSNQVIIASTGVVNFQGTGAQIVVGTSTAYAWGTGTKYPIVQLAGMGSLYGTATTGVVLTGGGLYYNGTNFIYGQAGTGVIASLGTGSFTVSCVNTSGTAAGTATPTVVFSIGGTVTSNKIQGYGPVAAALVDMTPDTGTFNGTLASVTAVVTCPCVWARNGNIVVLAIGTGTGTSNANDFTIGGLPAAITPTRTQRLEVPDYAVENSGAIGSITTDVELIMNTNGTMTFLNGGTATGWGATLFKGVAAMFTVPYILN